MAQLFDIKQAKTSSNAGGNNSRVGSSVNASDK
jgi:hypothetical protein